MSDMSSDRKPKKGLFRRKKQTPLTPPATNIASRTGDETAVPEASESPDRQRTKSRYQAAAKELEDAVRRDSSWERFEFPELCGELEDFDKSQFQDKINKSLESRERRAKDQKAWDKSMHMLECAFTALSPFAKNFLTIAKDSQSVLLLFITIFSSNYIDFYYESIRINLWRTACVDYS